MWQSHEPAGATSFGDVIGKECSWEAYGAPNFRQDDISAARHQVQFTPSKSRVLARNFLGNSLGKSAPGRRLVTSHPTHLMEQRMASDLKGKVVLITGASTGIGA